MSLDGLRAWIGEVERKLGKRTRVFLALSAIAIGIGGAAIYLALDARSDSVSEADVRELQEELEARIGAGGGAGDPETVARLESQMQALRDEVAQLREGEGGDGGGGAEGAGAGGAGGGGTGGGGADSGNGAGTGSTGAGAAGNAEEAQEKLQELLEQAQDQAEAGK